MRRPMNAAFRIRSVLSSAALIGAVYGEAKCLSPCRVGDCEIQCTSLQPSGPVELLRNFRNLIGIGGIWREWLRAATVFNT